MSRLAKSYEKAIKRELTAHAAWFPIINTFKIGDFGVFENGVFRSMGNIKDKYPELDLRIDQSPGGKVNFSSEGTKTFKFDAAGNIVGSFAQLGDANAALKFEFTKRNSVVLKADEIILSQLQNIEEVASFVSSKSDWKRKYKVITHTYTGENCLVICARESGSEFTINAKADILSDIEVGKANAGFETSSSNSSTYDSIGKTGVLALRFFKINWLGNIRVLSDSINKITIQDTFDGDLEDDF
jgi:hypothetical protein